jgi:hypothetical protein
MDKSHLMLPPFVSPLYVEPPVPRSVALVAMGSSHSTYTRLCALRGSRFRVADETWSINAMGGCIQVDRLFVMDDIRRILEDYETSHPTSTEAGVVETVRNHRGLVYTPVAYPEYPGTVAYPLEDVVRSIGHSYLNNSVAYAVAFAIHIGVKKLGLYGCDFTYPDRAFAESGRACVEFLLAGAMHRGMELEISHDSTLMDASVPVEKKLYGFAGKVEVIQTDDGLRVRKVA